MFPTLIVKIPGLGKFTLNALPSKGEFSITEASQLLFADQQNELLLFAL